MSGDPFHLAVIVGSVRPGRFAPVVANWFVGRAEQRADVKIDVLDLADCLLPATGQARPVAAGEYAHLLWVIAAAASGAFTGDHASYGVGHRFGQRIIGRSLRGRRGRAAQAWAEQMLRKRGGVVVVVARYIPGGRTATTLSAGGLRYPVQRFSPFDAVAASSWAAYASLLGYWGGAIFEDDPLKGIIAGVAVSVCITVAVELTRFLLRRRRAGRAASDLPSTPAPTTAHSSSPPAMCPDRNP